MPHQLRQSQNYTTVQDETCLLQELAACQAPQCVRPSGGPGHHIVTHYVGPSGPKKDHIVTHYVGPSGPKKDHIVTHYVGHGKKKVAHH